MKNGTHSGTNTSIAAPQASLYLRADLEAHDAREFRAAVLAEGPAARRRAADVGIGPVHPRTDVVVCPELVQRQCVAGGDCVVSAAVDCSAVKDWGGGRGDGDGAAYSLLLLA